jgi:hypothetical protein
MGSPGSRARRFRACHGSTTARDPLAPCDIAASGVAFRHSHNVDTPDHLISRLNSPAYTCPCERFAAPSRVANASLGVTVGRWPFGVELFHLLLLAGLSRRFRELRAKDRYPPATTSPTISISQRKRDLRRARAQPALLAWRSA